MAFFIQMKTILMSGCESSVTLRGSNFAWFIVYYWWGSKFCKVHVNLRKADIAQINSFLMKYSMICLWGKVALSD